MELYVIEHKGESMWERYVVYSAQDTRFEYLRCLIPIHGRGKTVIKSGSGKILAEREWTEDHPNPDSFPL